VALCRVGQQLAVAGDDAIAAKPALAAMMRSAGSLGGVPGKAVELMRSCGVSSASRTPGSASRVSNQTSGESVSCSRPFETRVPISQAVMGER